MKFYYTQQKENPHIKYLDMINEQKETFTIASMDLMGDVNVYKNGYDQEVKVFVETIRELYDI